MRVGDIVCNCQYMHLRIIAVDADGDTLTLEDGSICSYKYCCDPVPHPDFEHPSNKDN